MRWFFLPLRLPLPFRLYLVRWVPEDFSKQNWINWGSAQWCLPEISILDSVRWEEMGWDEMGWDEMGWDEMGWDEMGWEEMRWDEKRWEEMRWYEKRWDEKYAKITGSVNFTSLCLSSSCFSMHGAACNHSRHVLFSREERWFWGRSSSQMRCTHMRVWSARSHKHGVQSHPRPDQTSGH